MCEFCIKDIDVESGYAYSGAHEHKPKRMNEMEEFNFQKMSDKLWSDFWKQMAILWSGVGVLIIMLWVGVYHFSGTCA